MYVIKDKVIRLKDNKIEIENKNKNKQMNIFDFIGGWNWNEVQNENISNKTK